MCSAPVHVRFGPIADIAPLMTRSGLSQTYQASYTEV